jgi:hypothetical protein
VALAGWALFVRDDGGDGSASEPFPSLGRAGSEVVEGAPDVAIGPGPATYRIVYRVEDAGPEVGYRTDVVSVRRPWESRLESRRGRPPGDEELSTQVATFAQRYTTNPSADQPVVLELGPLLPASDVRLAAVLGPAVEAGKVERREVRRVAGRTCQVYRASDYLTASSLRPPTPELYADTCVDASGLVLEEVLVDDGRAIARRIAESVEEDVALDDGLFPTGTPNVQARNGGGSVRRLADGTTPPGPFFVADAVPEGFSALGRYSVVPPQAENFGDDLSREGFRRAGTADVYVRGLDVLVLEQGATLQGAPPFEVDPENPTVDLGPFGTGEIRFSAAGNVVRAARDGGRYVQATGTLPPSELAAVLRSLREVPGGELVYAEGE